MAVAYENLLYEVRDQIAHVTFNRPKVLNALNHRTMEEFGQILDAARVDADVRVLIVTGAGEKVFYRGRGYQRTCETHNGHGQRRHVWGQAVLHKLETLGKPSIAAINGFALGGGCELAMACTMRIASRTARLGQPEVKLGIIPGYGGSQRLPRLCGKGVAHELVLTGEMIPGRRGVAHWTCEPRG